MSTELPVLKSTDFASDQDIRWCPGCGDYSILAQMKSMLPSLGVPRETIIADFTMTERAVDLQKVLMRKKPNPRYAHYAKLDPEIRRAFSAARPSYIAAFLDTIAQRWKNAGNYLKELGISSDAQQDIRASLLD